MPFSPFVDFIEKNLRPSVIETQHMPNHLLFLLFSGKNVRAELSKVIGGTHFDIDAMYTRVFIRASSLDSLGSTTTR